MRLARRRVNQAMKALSPFGSAPLFEDKPTFRAKSLLKDRNPRAAGRRSSPGLVNNTASRSTSSSSLQPTSRTVTAAHVRACRKRQRQAKAAPNSFNRQAISK
jgi:hypothetical protein